ncbi:hypothetical protein SeMB42_g01926 [Synchytrium endobioticum]|uniref:Uncharacterized protein n=1 Tax=Synchytrium endobioticum TaxID=286115 RepID=A0A507DJL4_9FUNG|nr:hypothetical protein SeLEV6574_g01919 [Synchytrium endobioticum]TPX51435.1 hypothetical protein SeMB42_g01926 [Synchytrium endobioticum]
MTSDASYQHKSQSFSQQADKKGSGRQPKQRQKVMKTPLEADASMRGIPPLISLNSQSFSSLLSMSSQGSLSDLTKLCFPASSFPSLSMLPPLLYGLSKEVWTRAFSYIDNPTNFILASRHAKSIADETLSKTSYLRRRYGERFSFLNGYLKHRKLLTLEVTKSLLTNGALLPRYLIQLIIRDEGKFVVPPSKLKFVGLVLKYGIKHYGVNNLHVREDDVETFYKYLIRPGATTMQVMGNPYATAPTTGNAMMTQDVYGNITQIQPLSPIPINTVRELVVKYHFAPTMDDPIPLKGRRAYMIWRLVHDDPSLLPLLESNGFQVNQVNDQVIMNAFFRKHPLLPTLSVADSVKACVTSSPTPYFKFSDDLVLKIMTHERLHDAQLLALKQYYSRSQLDAFARMAVEKLLVPSKMMTLLHKTDPRHPIHVRMLLGHLTVPSKILIKLLTTSPDDYVVVNRSTENECKGMVGFGGGEWIDQQEFRRARLRWVVKVFGQDHAISRVCMEEFLKWL